MVRSDSNVNSLASLPGGTMTSRPRWPDRTGLKVLLQKTYFRPWFTRKGRSSWFLKLFSDEAVTAYKLFQLSHTPFENTNLPVSKLNLVWYSYKQQKKIKWEGGLKVFVPQAWWEWRVHRWVSDAVDPCWLAWTPRMNGPAHPSASIYTDTLM